jgi:formylglycine-generating enzyme required for sulfatase activity
MATDPADRYPSVLAFQTALRDYQEHAESITLSEQASKDLAEAESTGEYTTYAKALFGFEQALELWDGNDDARAGEGEAALQYAACAFEKGDFDLALSLLNRPEHEDLAGDVRAAKAKREARHRRIKILTYAAIGLILIIIGVVTFAYIRVTAAQAETLKALENTKAARALAEEKQVEAEQSADAARQARALAEQRKAQADQAAKKAREEEAKATAALARVDEALKAVSEAKSESERQAALARTERLRASEMEEVLKKRRDNTWWSYSADAAAEKQRAAAQELGKETELLIDIPDGQQLTLVVIPPDSFAMGSPPAEENRSSEEALHTVRLSRPFYLCRTELTLAQYKALTGGYPSGIGGEEIRPELPATNLNYRDIADELLSRLQAFAPEGYAFRLPTEAEWEYACRAGTHTPYYAGVATQALSGAGWHSLNADGRINPVGKKTPNAFGLYDMHGNVAEWCADSYGVGYYLSSPEEDPRNTEESVYRVVRGGSYANLPEHCRSAYRSYAHVNNRYPFLGVRFALSPKMEPAAPPAGNE